MSERKKELDKNKEQQEYNVTKGGEQGSESSTNERRKVNRDKLV
jgi:hypothetical protein